MDDLTTAEATTVPTSPPLTHDVIKVQEYWKKYNIKDAVDRMVKAWELINVATVLHGWKPLFPETKAGEGRQTADSTMQEAADAARLISTPSFQEVQATDIQEMISEHQPEPTIQEILLEDENEQPTNEEEPASVPQQGSTMQQLGVVLTELAHLTELLAVYDNRPDTQNTTFPLQTQVSNHYRDKYNSRINECQQALITQYLGQKQPEGRQLAAVLAVVDVEEEDNTVVVDVEDLPVSPDVLDDLPQDFLHFDAEMGDVGGGAGDQSSHFPALDNSNQSH